MLSKALTFFIALMANRDPNTERRITDSEFAPDVALTKYVTVDVQFHLAGRQRRMRIPMTLYYTAIEPVLAKVERECK